MPTESATYNYLSCAAKIDNLLHPKCGFLSDGGWEDLDTVRKRALVVGWTSPTKNTDLCPVHSAPADGFVMRNNTQRPRPPAPAQQVIEATPSEQQ